MCHVIPCYDTASHQRSSVSDNVSDIRAGGGLGPAGRRGGEEVAWGGHSLDKARLSVMQGFAYIGHLTLCHLCALKF